MGYLCLGAHFVMTPNAIITIFGLRSSVQLSSFIYTTRCPSGFLSMFLSQALVAKIGDSSFSVMFYSSCALIFISLVLLITLFKEEPIRRVRPVGGHVDDDDKYICMNE